MLLPGMCGPRCGCHDGGCEHLHLTASVPDVSYHQPALAFELAEVPSPTTLRMPSSTKLKSALQAYGVSDWKSQILRCIPLLQFGGVVGALGSALSPQGPGGSDHNRLERVANVLTSVPYVVIGVESMRRRKTGAGKLWGASIATVGLASATFHGSTGRFRSFGRKLDYWTIAASSSMLVKAVIPGLPQSVTNAGLLATPFKPFLVSFANSTAMEAVFLERSWKKPQLQPAQRLHSACALLGLGAFALEEYMPRLPLVHACWHCLSAVCVGTTNALLADVEEEQATRLKVQPLQLTH